ncbi:four helix bundle protein [bacterium]|nr:four helix bundle protein [bacterium]
MPTYFDHEKLRVYQQAIAFVVWCTKLFDSSPKRGAVYDQLDRASTSIPLNVAEGNGKFSKKDRCRFLDIAMSSALESAACLDVLVAKNHFKADDVVDGKKQLQSIVSMLMGLIANFSDRLGEEVVEYGSSNSEYD